MELMIAHIALFEGCKLQHRVLGFKGNWGRIKQYPLCAGALDSSVSENFLDSLSPIIFQTSAVCDRSYVLPRGRYLLIQ